MMAEELNEVFGVVEYPKTILSRLRSIVRRVGHAIADIPYDLQHLYQRARYGVSYRDSMSLDTHVAHVLARGLRHIRYCQGIFVSDPAGDFVYPENDDDAAWDELARKGEQALSYHADILERWVNHYELNTAEEDALYARVQETMHFIARNYDRLWH